MRLVSGTDQDGYRYVIGSKNGRCETAQSEVESSTGVAEVVNRKWFRKPSYAPKWKLKLYFNYIYIKIPEEFVLQIFK